MSSAEPNQRYSDQKLVEEALAARENAIAPFSTFRVGAALKTRAGQIYRGCNVENSTFGLTVCAERVALLSALAAGERAFHSIAVVTQSQVPASPCGACRQLLWEFCGDIPVLLASTSGLQKQFTLSTLFPEPFDFKPEV